MGVAEEVRTPGRLKAGLAGLMAGSIGGMVGGAVTAGLLFGGPGLIFGGSLALILVLLTFAVPLAAVLFGLPVGAVAGTLGGLVAGGPVHGARRVRAWLGGIAAGALGVAVVMPLMLGDSPIAGWPDPAALLLDAGSAVLGAVAAVPAVAVTLALYNRMVARDGGRQEPGDAGPPARVPVRVTAGGGLVPAALVGLLLLADRGVDGESLALAGILVLVGLAAGAVAGGLIQRFRWPPRAT